MASVIEWVDTVDRVKQGTVRLSRSDCGFAYRMSRFKSHDAGRFVVCDVTFRLRLGSPTVAYPGCHRLRLAAGIASPDVRSVREAVLAIRARKGMVIDAADPDTRSVGSFFMNPVVDRARFEEIATAFSGSADRSASAEASADKAGPRVPHYLMENDTVKIPAAWLIEQSGFSRGHVDGASACQQAPACHHQSRWRHRARCHRSSHGPSERGAGPLRCGAASGAGLRRVHRRSRRRRPERVDV